MLTAALDKPCSPELIQHLFTTSHLLDWLVALPSAIVPTPIPVPAHAQSQAATATAKAPLRAGYLGHVTAIASTLEEIVVRTPRQDAASITAVTSIRELLAAHEGWQTWRVDVLAPRLEVENVSKWACGRPAATDLGHLDSDNDEYAVGATAVRAVTWCLTMITWILSVCVLTILLHALLTTGTDAKQTCKLTFLNACVRYGTGVLKHMEWEWVGRIHRVLSLQGCCMISCWMCSKRTMPMQAGEKLGLVYMGLKWGGAGM